MIAIFTKTSSGMQIADYFKTEVRVELIAWLGGSTAPFPDDVCPDIKA